MEHLLDLIKTLQPLELNEEDLDQLVNQSIMKMRGSEEDAVHNEVSSERVGRFSEMTHLTNKMPFTNKKTSPKTKMHFEETQPPNQVSSLYLINQEEFR